MAQLTVRADASLVERVRGEAERQGRSMNDFVTAVLRAATDPSLEGTEAERVRARLRLAGLLDDVGPIAIARPSRQAVAAASRRAARGRSASELVADGR